MKKSVSSFVFKAEGREQESDVSTRIISFVS